MIDETKHDKVLIVDDDDLVRELIASTLESEGYVCTVAHNVDTALEILERKCFSVIMSDIQMGDKSGIDLLKTVKKRFPDTAVIMVTAADDRKTAIHALELGAYDYIAKPFDINEITISVHIALERRRLSIKSKEYEIRLEEDVKNRTAEIHRREEEICVRLTAACEYRDVETGTHNRRLGQYASVLAEQIGWNPHAVDEIRIAASMHDIGKIAVPDNILLKENKLNANEFEKMKKHTVIGGKLLSGTSIPLLNMARDIALFHHEKWDGSGYPNGMKHKKIPESARLVAVLDVYDALVHTRVYRSAIPEEKALQMIVEGKGSHFDPEAFDVFVSVLPKLREIRMKIREEGE